MEERFCRTAMLIGETGLARLRAAASVRLQRKRSRVRASDASCSSTTM